MSRFTGALLLALAFYFFALSARPAASQAAAVPEAKSSVAQIALPVVIRDKKGALLTTISPSDVTLTVDNQPLKINSFSIQSSEPFLLGLLVQTTHGMENARGDLKTAAGNFINQMVPGATANQAFLIHFDRAVELLSDFSPKAAEIHQELNTLAPTQIAHQGHAQDEGADDGEQVGARSGGFGNSRVTSTLYDAIFLAADELMKGKTGRKALIVFSDGVDRGSKESLTDAIDAADHANLTIYTLLFRGEAEHQGFSGLPGQNNGHHGGIGFPGGWPGGGGGRNGGGNEPKPAIDGKKIMEQLANRTGGRFFEIKKKEGLSDAYSEIATELKGQYLLTFTPEKPDPDGGYHKVALKTKDESLKVQTREGYYAPLN